MSFEGYYQTICKVGHSQDVDVYNVSDDDTENVLCWCGEELVWWNLVDVTNGSYDENGDRIDGYIELEMLSENVCYKCGHVVSRCYKVPDKGGCRVE